MESVWVYCSKVGGVKEGKWERGPSTATLISFQRLLSRASAAPYSIERFQQQTTLGHLLANHGTPCSHYLSGRKIPFPTGSIQLQRQAQGSDPSTVALSRAKRFPVGTGIRLVRPDHRGRGRVRIKHPFARAGLSVDNPRCSVQPKRLHDVQSRLLKQRMLRSTISCQECTNRFHGHV